MSFPFIAPIRALCRHGALIVSAGLLALPFAGTNAAPLTLAEAQRLALERSRQLAADDMGAASAREMAVAAGQLPDPVLKFGVDNLPADGADRFSLNNDFMTMRRIGVMQEITSADKRQLRADRYQREAEKNLAEKALNTADIQRDTALAWLNRYYTEAMAAVIAEQGAQARLEMRAAEGAYRAGRGSQADVLAARSALAAFDDRRSEFERRIRSAKTMLVRWAGEAGHAPLAGEPAIDTVRLNLANLGTHLAHHPQIAVLGRREEIAETEAKLAQANEKADWSVELAYQQRGPAYSNMVSIGVSIPLQWNRKNRQDRELASKLALVEQAKAERDEALRMHIAETRSMIDEWQNGRERIARYRRELIPLANQRTAAALTAYRGGKAGLNEVLAARRNELDVRLQALQLEADTARLWAQLNFLFPEDLQGTNAASTVSKDIK
jgi:outer membrane protein TolC